MKINNETKVGLLAIAAILILVIGFNFLKGKPIFSKSLVIYAVFKQIGTLEKSNQVKINGLPVGKVYNYVQANAQVDSIIVEIHLNQDILIPSNSIALINGSPLGATYISILKGDQKQYLQPNDTINARTDPSLLANLQQQLTPTLTRVNETLDSLKITIGNITSIFDPTTKNNLRDVIAHLAISSASLQELMNAQTGLLAQSLGNINNVTGNLSRQNEVINSAIRNVEVTTTKLANANIEGVVAALKSTVDQLHTTISNLSSSKGTLGLMMNDRQLYDKLDGVAARLNSTALSAEILLDDVRLHPKRYVNISIFGGKNKGDALTSPSAKDTIPVTP